MKAKKGKNVSVQISLYDVFDEMSNVEYLQQFINHPEFLAAQIDDLKTLLQFSASNYTQKARSILNLSKEFTKAIEGTIQGVNEMDMGLYQMPQSSYPEMAYEALKRSTSLELEEDGNQELDWRAVQTEFQLKFLESKNLEQSLEWEKCYNPQERCIQISKNTAIKPFMNGHGFQKFQQNNSLQVDLSLKIENGIIVWDVKKVTYQKNAHYGLLTFYKEDLMRWVREQYPNSIEESDKYFLSLVHKSLDYIDVILLYMQLKNTPFNQNIEESDKKNGILNLFDPKEVDQSSHFKLKNLKVCFILPFSNLPPSIILRVDSLNVLKIEFTTENQIIFKVKLKNKKQEMTLKKLVGSIKKTNFSLKNLTDISKELLECIQTYENFVDEKVEKFKLDIFLSNRTTNLILYFKNINAVLVEEDISENQKISEQIEYDLAQENIKFSGIYLIFNSQYFASMPAIISYISSDSEILFKNSKTMCGFGDRVLKDHPSMSFEDLMYHIHYFELIGEAQEKSNWSLKLVYCDVYSEKTSIVYKFKIMTQKRVVAQNSIIKKDPKQDQYNPFKDFNIYVKIAENFKSIEFLHVSYGTSQMESTKSDSSMSSGNKSDVSSRHLKPPEEIPDKYFKDNWREYIKKRNDSEVLKNEYLDPSMVLKATHYVLNHFEFIRFFKPRTGIFKNEEITNLMDE